MEALPLTCSGDCHLRQLFAHGPPLPVIFRACKSTWGARGSSCLEKRGVPQTVGQDRSPVTQSGSDRGKLRPRGAGFDPDQGLLPPASPAAREQGARSGHTQLTLCQGLAHLWGAPVGRVHRAGTRMMVSCRGQKHPHHLTRICREGTVGCPPLCRGSESSPGHRQSVADQGWRWGPV